MQLSARYLITERPKGERVSDRVAHFHLSNGARLERINWLADTSVSGLERSAGIMVNYVYSTSFIISCYALSGQSFGSGNICGRHSFSKEVSIFNGEFIISGRCDR